MSVIDRGDARFRRDVARLHGLGPRAVFELLDELARRRLLRDEIERLVSKYARAEPIKLAYARGVEIPSAAAEVADCLDRAVAYARSAEGVVDDGEVAEWLNAIVSEIERAEDALTADAAP